MDENENLITDQEVNELQQELIEVARERQQEKQRTEERRRADEDWSNQVKDFTDNYPNVDLEELNNDKKFLEFASGKRGTVKSIYEGYLKTLEETGKKKESTKHQKVNLTENQRKLADQEGMSYKEYAERLRYASDEEPSPKVTKLTDRQIKLCKSCGMSPEEYLRCLNEM